MKTNDFGRYLNKYLTSHLPDNRGSTPLTIDSYRYTFILFLTYMEEIQKISVEKLKISDLIYENIILET